MKKLILSAAITLALPAHLAAAAGEAPPAPPELARTVAAFVGKAVYDTTITLPDGQAKKTKLTFDCKKTALGKAVACEFGGMIPGVGPYEGSFLIGYDTQGKAVHFMAITSNEEVHDHKCHWRGNDLACDLLKGGMGGHPITEDLSFSFGEKKKSFKSTITMPDGSRMMCDAIAKK